MKTRSALFISVLAVAMTSGIQTAQASPRVVENINAGWNFHYGECPDAKKTDFVDKDWKNISLPHTWNNEDLRDDKPGYKRGIGWYRKWLVIPETMNGKTLFLCFEGANQVTEVWVNGKMAGEHIGGYTGFNFDITPFIKRGKPNLVAIKVDNSHNPNIPPLSADFNFYGGIYRDVRLVAVNPIHFSLEDDGSNGVYAWSGEITQDIGEVHCKAILVNKNRLPGSVKFRVTLTGLPAGEDSPSSVSQEADAIVAWDEPFEFTGVLRYFSPRFWSPEEPYLYTIRWEVLIADEVIDSVETPFAFRTYEADPQKGFFLNGKPYRLMGSNRHQDVQGYGWAVPNEAHVRDMEIIKAMGANFVRLAHYPQDQAVLEAADRLGLILWEEIPIVNYVTESPEFRNNTRQMITEMIKQHMNHPSIFFWGYMNEVFLKDNTGGGWGNPETLPKSYVDWVVGLAQELNDLAHELDPSRKTVIALVGHDTRNRCGLPAVPDITGWNIYCGWYVNQPPQFGEFFDEQHKKYPKRAQMVSEYGAGSDARLHSIKPERFDFTTEWQQYYHESHVEQIFARPWLCGATMWIQFDFPVENRSDSMEHINQKGLCTVDRNPKDIYFYYKARLSDTPVLHIASHEWDTRVGIKGIDVPQPVKVYSNCDEVELFVNGKSQGKKKTEGKGLAIWDIRLKPDAKKLSAKGTYKGKELTDEVPIRYVEFDCHSPELRINVGSKAQFEDSDGNLWLPDREYSEGYWGHIGGKPGEHRTWPNILKTRNDPLFQSAQIGIESYRLDVPDGKYEITLLFAEMKNAKPGECVFEVEIQSGNTGSSDIVDVVKEAGTNTPFSMKAITTAANGKGLEIRFIPKKGNPYLNALLIKKVN